MRFWRWLSRISPCFPFPLIFPFIVISQSLFWGGGFLASHQSPRLFQADSPLQRISQTSPRSNFKRWLKARADGSSTRASVSRGLEGQVRGTLRKCVCYALDYTLLCPRGEIVQIWEWLEMGRGEQLEAIGSKLAVIKLTKLFFFPSNPHCSPFRCSHASHLNMKWRNPSVTPLSAHWQSTPSRSVPLLDGVIN